MIQNILDINGNVIGTLELPDGTSSDVVASQLALYTYSNPNPTTAQVINSALDANAVFGSAMMRSFETTNVAAGITQAGMTQTITEATHYLYHYLVTGSLYGAITEIQNLNSNSSLSSWSPYITTAILQSYMNQIQVFLKIPQTTL